MATKIKHRYNVKVAGFDYVRETTSEYTHAAVHIGTRWDRPAAGVTMHKSAAAAQKATCVWIKVESVIVVPVTEAPRGMQTSRELRDNSAAGPACWFLPTTTTPLTFDQTVDAIGHATSEAPAPGVGVPTSAVVEYGKTVNDIRVMLGFLTRYADDLDAKMKSEPSTITWKQIGDLHTLRDSLVDAGARRFYEQGVCEDETRNVVLGVARTIDVTP